MIFSFFYFKRLNHIKILLGILILYGVWFFSSSLWSSYPEIVYKGFKKEFLYSVAALIIGYNCSLEFKSNKPIILFGLLSLILLFIASISLIYPDHLARAVKFYPEVGDASTSLIFFFSLSIALFLKSKSSTACLLLGIFSLTLSCYLAVFYANRMLFVSLATILGVIFIYKLNNYPLKIKLISGISMIIIATGLVTYSLSIKIDSTSLNISSAKEVVKNDPRIGMWDFYLSKAFEKPIIGYGAGYLSLQETFKNDFPDDSPGYFKTHAHNVLINKWLQLGAIGLFLFIMMYGYIFYYAYNGNFNDNEKSSLKIFLIMIFIGFFSKSFTDDFFIRNNIILFWLLCGYIMGRGAPPISPTKE